MAFLKNEFAGFGADVFNDTIKEFELIVSPIGFSGKVNKVGEATNNLFTKEKQVRRRVFKIDERRSSVEGVKPKGRPRYSTNRQSAWVSNNRFNIQYADGKSQNWPLPLHGDKDGLRKVLYEALKFGTESGASKGQLDAIRKELNKEGYYLIK